MIAEDEEHLEARLRLANVLEEQGHKAEALDIVTEGMSLSHILFSGQNFATIARYDDEPSLPSPLLHMPSTFLRLFDYLLLFITSTLYPLLRWTGEQVTYPSHPARR